MKRYWLVFFFIILISLYGCSSKDIDLDLTTRIDINFPAGEDRMIVEESSINLCLSIWERIQWDQEESTPNEIEPVMLSLFILTDENMPERLYDYSIWFTESGANIWDHEKDVLGKLEIDQSLELKEVLENHSKPDL